MTKLERQIAESRQAKAVEHGVKAAELIEAAEEKQAERAGCLKAAKTAYAAFTKTPNKKNTEKLAAATKKL